MERIAKYLNDLHITGSYCQNTYEDFVSSAAANAPQFCYDGLRRMSITSFGDLAYARTLDSFAAQFRADILSAQLTRMNNNSGIEVVERIRPPNMSVDICIRNCTKQWMLEADPPFVKVDLMDVVLHWQEKKGITVFQKITDLYRKILGMSTSPPSEIQKYSVRMNRRSRRNGTLMNLPAKVEETLIGFGEDLLGLGHKELMAAPGASVWASRSPLAKLAFIDH
ncbi:hypothetical protein TELCIR_09506 [Teladorsagia circumcincta]|uniref:Uncharacterized protein n=1 Tax=Teladorsagia circumcincta TaxID=45464 RepID=A0A2G9UEM1_TELCI|nr:hypothetical protein TELCIR_09506 [Teladorsagia circumcincta]